MTSHFAFPRKLSCLLTLLAFTLLGAVSQEAHANSLSVGGGTLSWSETSSTVSPCNSPTFGYSSITTYTYTSFSFKSSTGVVTPFSGDVAHYYQNNNCAQSEPKSGGPSLALQGSTFTITFYPGSYGSGTATYTVNPVSYQGYIDPKYVVVGVTYAPPGPSTNTFVNYVNSTFVGNTTSTINTIGSGSTYGVSLQYTFKIPLVASAQLTGGYATTGTQSTANTSTVTTSIQVDSGEQTFGTGNYFAPVDNDYDVIWVWLNPVAIYTLTGTTVTWNGYGADATDQNGLDIVGIPLGYLNGDFGPISSVPQYWIPIQRTWAANQMFGSGQGPALTSADLAQIASFDPFSNSSYGPDYIGYAPPGVSTYDNRFTLTECNSGNSISYDQASPSSNAEIATCALKYVNLSTQAQSIITTSSQTYSLDEKFTGTGFFNKWVLDVNQAWTFSTKTEADTSITTSTTNTGSLSVQGPPCNNLVLGVGPCVPVFDAAGNQPYQFDIYQDNMFGTFMFAPVHYF